MPYKKGTTEYDDWKKRRADAVKKWRLKTKLQLIDAFGGHCQICNYSKSHWALEFHHLFKEDKTFSIAQALAKPKNIKAITNELKKCVLLCSNCHREVEQGILELEDVICVFDDVLFLDKIAKKEHEP